MVENEIAKHIVDAAFRIPLDTRARIIRIGL